MLNCDHLILFIHFIKDDVCICITVDIYKSLFSYFGLKPNMTNFSFILSKPIAQHTEEGQSASHHRSKKLEFPAGLECHKYPQDSIQGTVQ
jgi:hypothetical protein